MGLSYIYCGWHAYPIPSRFTKFLHYELLVAFQMVYFFFFFFFFFFSDFADLIDAFSDLPRNLNFIQHSGHLGWKL
jgi:hypothetical protein